MSILIIDSDPGSEVRLKGFLGGYGFECVEIIKTAANTREFFKNSEDNNADDIRLIIINSELEDADGYELCRELHKTEIGKKAYKIVLVSSAKNEKAIIKTRQSDANDFSVKPYESTEFIKHLMLFTYQKVVLLVEDDPVIRQLVTSILRKKVVEVIVKMDGLEAYNMINSMAPPKLVLLDIGLPGMNGIKLVEHIRAIAVWRKTPIIMLTGSTDSDDVKGSLGAGANDYIVKPFQIDDFVSRIDKYFDVNE
jgi:DNA-binding response OmpR family regulator